ncbi:MAG: NAAT family transporter [Candidatus Krumholzibacteriota bacterium]|nr:NAAT family transporter [Candidatus Krumholzibacteriota bacterium]
MNPISIIVAFTAIFIIINPFSKVPFFLLLTKGYTKEEKRKVVLHAIRISVFVLIAFALAGKYLFTLLNISELSMRVVGSLVIIKIGFEMMSGKIPTSKPSSDERDEAIQKEMVGVIPLGIPMIAGPGSIITVMTFVAKAQNALEVAAIIGSILITCLVTFILLLKADIFYNRIGEVGLHTIMRLLGILIAAIGVEMMLDSITIFMKR